MFPHEVLHSSVCIRENIRGPPRPHDLDRPPVADRYRGRLGWPRPHFRAWRSEPPGSDAARISREELDYLLANVGQVCSKAD